MTSSNTSPDSSTNPPPQRTSPRPLDTLDLRVPQQQRSRARRDALLAAALALFAREGYMAVTTDRIAGEAGVAVGSFYVYFKSKGEVLLVLMDRLLVELEAFNLDAPATAPVAGVRGLVAAAVRAALHADLAHAGVYRAWREAMVVEPMIAEWDAPIRTWTEGRIAALFGALTVLPGARRGVDMAAVAALINRLFWDLLTDPHALTPTTFDVTANALTDMLFHTLFER